MSHAKSNKTNIEIYLDEIQKNPEYYGIYRSCNICGFRFSKFKLFNKLHPREALCPVCGSLERHRHLAIHLFSLFPFLEGKNVLHFAPESIIKKILLKSKCNYYDADLNPNNAKYKVDITKIEFDEDFFDYIICIHVLEHIIDDVKAMSEIHRVLKPGGTAYLSVPYKPELYGDYSITTPEEREKAFGQNNHVRC